MKHVVSLGQAGMQDQHTYKILVLKKMRFPKLQVFVPFGKRMSFRKKKTCVSVASWKFVPFLHHFAPSPTCAVSFFPTCRSRWGLLDFMSAGPPPPPPSSAGPQLQALHRKLQIKVFPAGPQPWAPDQSVHQPQRISENIPDRTPERMSEDMPDIYICQKEECHKIWHMWCFEMPWWGLLEVK